MKNIIKDFIFVIIFIILLYFVSNGFVLKGNTYGSDVFSFYEEKKNSLDLIFFGSSHSYATFSPNVLEEQTGLKSYNFATQQQPVSITYYYMVEALKTQKPKYFVLESWMLSYHEDYSSEGVVRDALDKMNFSLNKIKAIQANVESKDDYASYYLNIIKYHSRYNEITLKEFLSGVVKRGIKNRGFISLPSDESVGFDNKDILKNEDKVSIPEKNLEYLNKIVELCEDNNITLILVISPCELSLEKQRNFNWLEEYATEHKIEFINYNEQFKELELGKGDFFDSGHLSGQGANKVTQNFSNYINDFMISN